MLPAMGDLTLVVAALSYAGQLNLAAAPTTTAARTWRCSPTACTRSLDDLARSALVSAPY